MTDHIPSARPYTPGDWQASGQQVISRTGPRDTDWMYVADAGNEYDARLIAHAKLLELQVKGMCAVYHQPDEDCGCRFLLTSIRGDE